jgi:predicted nucleotidyltransferase
MSEILEALRNAAFEFAIRVSKIRLVEQVILFGSVARGEADRRSDVDIVVILDSLKPIAELEEARKVSEIALDVERDLGKPIQLIITNKNFEKLDEYFVKQILSEGIVLYGKSICIVHNKLKLAPFAVVNYILEGLSQTEKMRVKRAIYGQTTHKKTKNKIYTTTHEGMLKKAQGEKLGSGSIIVPKNNLHDIEETLKRLGVNYRVIDVWRII